MRTTSQITEKHTQLLTKRRWTRSEAATAVQAWRDSGMSLRAFCERHGVDEQRVARWAKNFPTPLKFAEVVVVGDHPSSRPSPLVIELGEARVYVEHDVDDELLARVLRVVGSVC